MGKIKIIARCDAGGVRVGYICIDKEKHLAWFTDYNFNKAWFTSNNIGDVVKKCESLLIVTPLKIWNSR